MKVRERSGREVPGRETELGLRCSSVSVPELRRGSYCKSRYLNNPHCRLFIGDCFISDFRPIRNRAISNFQLPMRIRPMTNLHCFQARSSRHPFKHRDQFSDGSGLQRPWRRAPRLRGLRGRSGGSESGCRSTRRPVGFRSGCCSRQCFRH